MEYFDHFDSFKRQKKSNFYMKKVHLFNCNIAKFMAFKLFAIPGARGIQL